MEQILPAVWAPFSTKLIVSPHIIFHSPRVFLLTIPLLFSTGLELASKITVSPSQRATAHEINNNNYYKFFIAYSNTYSNLIRPPSVRSRIDRHIVNDSECMSLIANNRIHFLNILLQNRS